MGDSRKDITFIKKFDGKLIFCDAVAHELIDAGIQPDYVTWLETSDKLTEWVVLSLLPRLEYATVVYRMGKYPRFFEAVWENKVKVKPFSPSAYVNNVGLMSIEFAQKTLQCKELHLIGMEHSGGDYSEGWFSDMIGAFNRFWCDRDKDCEIIDHSPNGRLFSSI